MCFVRRACIVVRSGTGVDCINITQPMYVVCRVLTHCLPRTDTHQHGMAQDRFPCVSCCVSCRAPGACKILFRLPLIWFILVKYAVACGLTVIARESITAVAWDSAGAHSTPTLLLRQERSPDLYVLPVVYTYSEHMLVRSTYSLAGCGVLLPHCDSACMGFLHTCVFYCNSLHCNILSVCLLYCRCHNRARNSTICAVHWNRLLKSCGCPRRFRHADSYVSRPHHQRPTCKPDQDSCQKGSSYNRPCVEDPAAEALAASAEAVTTAG